MNKMCRGADDSDALGGRVVCMSIAARLASITPRLVGTACLARAPTQPVPPMCTLRAQRSTAVLLQAHEIIGMLPQDPSIEERPDLHTTTVVYKIFNRQLQYLDRVIHEGLARSAQLFV